MKSPFFIVGLPRSGTTLLSVILKNHSSVFIDKVTYAHPFLDLHTFLKRTYKRNEDIGSRTNKERLSEAIDMIERLKPYKDYLLNESISLSERYLNIYSKILSNNNKSLLGDKCPPLLSRISELNFLFPNAKFIHIIRDGRAVALSQKERQYTNLYLAMDNWKKEVINALLNKNLIGENRILTLYYEDLIKDPKSTAQKVCSFLEIEFEEKMIELEMSESTRQSDSYVSKQFDSNKINSWEKKLSKKEIIQLEKIAGDLLLQLNYPLVNKELKKFKTLSPYKIIFYRIIDGIKKLFQKKKMVMSEERMVEWKTPPFKKRLSDLISLILNSSFSSEVVNQLKFDKRLF